jgi:hypothetical protein
VRPFGSLPIFTFGSKGIGWLRLIWEKRCGEKKLKRKMKLKNAFIKIFI